MRRGTTPGYVLRVAGADLTRCTNFATVAQGSKKLTLTGDRLAVSYSAEDKTSTVCFELTQEETLGFCLGRADVQVRFVDEAGYADATNVGSIAILPILNEDVIDYVPAGD